MPFFRPTPLRERNGLGGWDVDQNCVKWRILVLVAVKLRTLLYEWYHQKNIPKCSSITTNRHHGKENRCREPQLPWSVIKKECTAQEMLLSEVRKCVCPVRKNCPFLLYYWNVKNCNEKKVWEFLFRLWVIKNSNDSGVKENAERRY